MKVLIIEPCFIPSGEVTPTACAQGDVVDVKEDLARQLVANGRALYVEKKDDPSRGNLLTASPELVSAASEAIAGRKKAAKG